MAHSIRLREPWEREALGAEGGGPCKYSRGFHKPTGLEAGSRVWLVVDELAGEVEVRVNGQKLGRIEPGCYPARFDITAALKANNLVEITVRQEEGGRGGPEVVKLEIEEADATSETTGQKNLTRRHRGAKEASAERGAQSGERGADPRSGCPGGEQEEG